MLETKQKHNTRENLTAPSWSENAEGYIMKRKREKERRRRGSTTNAAPEEGDRTTVVRQIKANLQAVNSSRKGGGGERMRARNREAGSKEQLRIGKGSLKNQVIKKTEYHQKGGKWPSTDKNKKTRTAFVH